jgi:hypothetical protein
MPHQCAQVKEKYRRKATKLMDQVREVSWNARAFRCTNNMAPGNAQDVMIEISSSTPSIAAESLLNTAGAGRKKLDLVHSFCGSKN